MPKQSELKELLRLLLLRQHGNKPLIKHLKADIWIVIFPFLFTDKDAADKKPDEDKQISETLKSNLTDAGRSVQVCETAAAFKD